MSRITRARIDPGDLLTSTDLNNRYSDYTQTDLNLDNAADQSIDYEQLPANPVLKAVHQQQVGTGDVQHTSVQTVTRALTPGATILAPAAGFQLGGASGFTLATNDVLRVYVTYQCRSLLNGLDPNSTPPMGRLLFTERGGSAATQVNIGAMAWLFQLQWDITSSSLTNWASLPNQNNMASNWSSTGYPGAGVDELAGSAFVPAWWSGGMYWENGRHNQGNFNFQTTGWRAVTLTWVYQNTGGPVTVHGLRTVAHGLFHPYNDGSENGIVLDTTAGYTNNPSLEVGIGNAVVMHMRGP